jgi:hypothetical protein
MEMTMAATDALEHLSTLIGRPPSQIAGSVTDVGTLRHSDGIIGVCPAMMTVNLNLASNRLRSLQQLSPPKARPSAAELMAYF